MSEESRSFKVGIDFESVLRAISKQIYETPLAFIRENVQNAVDAVRIQALREDPDPGDDRYRIDIVVEDRRILVRDNGTGMSASDLENFFWTIGASGKRTKEAIAAGCVGMFGIGGFANFGVCHTLEVISQTGDSRHGTLTRLSEADIQKAGTAIPSVTVETSDEAKPRGTIVVGHLRQPPNVEELRRYLQDFVKFVPTAIYFNRQRKHFREPPMEQRPRNIFRLFQPLRAAILKIHNYNYLNALFPLLQPAWSGDSESSQIFHRSIPAACAFGGR